MSNCNRLNGLKDREKKIIMLKKFAVIVRNLDVLSCIVIALLLGLIVMDAIVLNVLILRIMKAIEGKLLPLHLIGTRMLLSPRLKL